MSDYLIPRALLCGIFVFAVLIGLNSINPERTSVAGVFFAMFLMFKFGWEWRRLVDEEQRK